MEERDHPFRVLRGKGHIQFKIHVDAEAAGGAFYARRGDRAVIVVSPDLTPEARSCALAHELVHDEYGVLSPPATEATMERIEHMVDRDVAEWLVPMDQLMGFVTRMSEYGPVEAWMVAEEFHVTEEVARRATARLLEREYLRSRSSGPEDRTDPRSGSDDGPDLDRGR